MKIEFTDREYCYEHGKGPKGYGRWGFEFEGHEFWATGTLGEAKKACKAEIRRIAPEGYTETVYANILP